MLEAVREAAKPLAVQSEGTCIPTVHWRPRVPCRGVVVACHGGSGHKLSAAILSIAHACLPLGLAVVAIDGPVHGDRRSDGSLDPRLNVQSFRQAWQAGVGHTSMAREMMTALDVLLEDPALRTLPVGYVGVSMGTGYGIPLLALDARFCAAAIGLWGLNFPASEHLVAYAKQISCAVWFTQQWDDQTFDREGTFALFDAIGSADKRLVAFTGPHRELEGERLREAIEFLRRRMLDPQVDTDDRTVTT